MSLQGGLSIERMCQLAGVSTAGFYRHMRSRDTHDEEMHVRSDIQSMALEHEGHYGYRRVTAELRRRGMLVNHKRVARILREDALIAAPRQWPIGRRNRRDMYVNAAARHESHGDKSAMGSRYYPRPPEAGIRLSSSGPGQVLAKGGRLVP